MKLFTGARLILLSLIFVGLIGCSGGGGGSTSTIGDAKPAGYYAGTLSTVSPSQTDISAKAIVDSDKFLMVHIDNAGSNTLLYKGAFTDITGTTYTADVRVYLNGAFLRVATISNGTITEKSSIAGTLSGTGEYTSTSFSLTYDTTINSRAPLVSANSDAWIIPARTDTGFGFSSPTEITNIYQDIAEIHDVLKGCEARNLALTNVNSEQPGRIRTYTASYTTSVAVSKCVNFTADFSMTGSMTPFDNGGTDNRYLWITYNDNNFYAEALVKR